MQPMFQNSYHNSNSTRYTGYPQNDHSYDGDNSERSDDHNHFLRNLVKGFFLKDDEEWAMAISAMRCAIPKRDKSGILGGGVIDLAEFTLDYSLQNRAPLAIASVVLVATSILAANYAKNLLFKIPTPVLALTSIVTVISYLIASDTRDMDDPFRDFYRDCIEGNFASLFGENVEDNTSKQTRINRGVSHFAFNLIPAYLAYRVSTLFFKGMGVAYDGTTYFAKGICGTISSFAYQAFKSTLVRAIFTTAIVTVIASEAMSYEYGKDINYQVRILNLALLGLNQFIEHKLHNNTSDWLLGSFGYYVPMFLITTYFSTLFYYDIEKRKCNLIQAADIFGICITLLSIVGVSIYRNRESIKGLFSGAANNLQSTLPSINTANGMMNTLPVTTLPSMEFNPMAQGIVQSPLPNMHAPYMPQGYMSPYQAMPVTGAYNNPATINFFNANTAQLPTDGIALNSTKMFAIAFSLCVAAVAMYSMYKSHKEERRSTTSYHNYDNYGYNSSYNH